MDSKEIVNQLTDSLDRAFAGKIIDKGLQAIKQRRTILTGFLDPYQQKVAEKVLHKIPDVSFFNYGGYPGTERTRIAIMLSCYKQETHDIEVAYLLISGNFKFIAINHRDVLGALLSLGLKRETLGDISVSEVAVKVIVTKEVAPYIISNLKQIHQSAVKIELLEADSFELPAKRLKEIKGTVASLRLDAVASLGYGVSRTKMVAVIKAEQVKVNWQPVKNSAAILKEGDVISIAGKGRVELALMTGKSRKGRVRLVLKKYY